MRLAIAVIGPMASGKGVVVSYLEDKGFCTFSLSDRIREELRKEGKEITRSNLRDTAHKLRKEKGPDILAKMTVEKINDSECNKVVVESIRNPFELKFIRKEYNAKVLGVTASQERRYKFLQKRNREGDIKSYEEFIAQDNEELESGVRHKMNIKDALEEADHVIRNDGSIKDLKDKVDGFFRKYNIS